MKDYRVDTRFRELLKQGAEVLDTKHYFNEEHEKVHVAIGPVVDGAKAEAWKTSAYDHLNRHLGASSAFTRSLFTSNISSGRLRDLEKTMAIFEQSYKDWSNGYLDSAPSAGLLDVWQDEAKEDEELDRLLDDLIEGMRRILHEGEEELTAKLAKQLEKILSELEMRKKDHPANLHPVLDLSATSLFAFTDALTTGMPFTTTAWGVVKVAFETRKRWLDVMERAVRKSILNAQPNGLSEQQEAIRMKLKTAEGTRELEKRIPKLDVEGDIY